MRLESKNALVYGAGGSVAVAVARAFAREGANVVIANRAIDPHDRLIVEQHVESVAKEVGRLDVSFNAMTSAKAQLLTATVAARQMIKQRSGVILTMPSESFESSRRRLARELGPHGVRVVSLQRGARPADVVACAEAAFLSTDRPQAALKALLGPQRMSVLLSLDGPKTAGEIAQALHTVPGGATHHLRGLEAAGLLTRVRRGQYVIVERTARATALLALYGAFA